jgi:parallel beta-helix repeat protein
MCGQLRTRHRVRSALLVIGLVTLGMTYLRAAGTFYVGTSGTNSSSCGADTSPCATVSYVLSNRVSAGDTIRVLPGTYSNQGDISFSSANHRNVTLTAADPANRPQLLNTKIALNKGGASGVTVSYLRIRAASSGFDDYVGVITVADFPVTIDHNELWNGGQGILIRTSQQVTASNNDIHDLGLPNTDYDTHCVAIANWNNDPNSTSFSTAIRLTGNKLHNCGGDGMQENSFSETGHQFNFLIMDGNTIYGNEEQGIDTKGTDDFRIYGNDIYGNGFGGISNNSIYGSTARWDIYNNRIHDHTNFAIFNQGGGSVWRIWDNIIYNNLTNSNYNLCAVELPGDSGSVFYGNTVYNNQDTSGSMQTCGVGDNGSGNNIVNNVFYNNGTGSNDRGNIRNANGGDSGTPSFNYVYPATCSTGQCKSGSNVKSTCFLPGNCPGFVSIATNDFHLLPGSPAINAGTPQSVPYTVDLEGRARGQGGAWDLGAYEAGGLAAPTNLRVIR